MVDKGIQSLNWIIWLITPLQPLLGCLAKSDVKYSLLTSEIGQDWEPCCLYLLQHRITFFLWHVIDFICRQFRYQHIRVWSLVSMDVVRRTKTLKKIKRRIQKVKILCGKKENELPHLLIPAVLATIFKVYNLVDRRILPKFPCVFCFRNILFVFSFSFIWFRFDLKIVSKIWKKDILLRLRFIHESVKPSNGYRKR